MAVNRFKLALNAARFPLVSTKAQRAVFVPGLDSALRAGENYAGSPESVDANRAQIIYGENFMPVSEGVRSVGYREVIAPTIYHDFDQIFALRDENENTVLYSPGYGKNYVYDTLAGNWNSQSFNDIHGVDIDPASPNTEASAKITYAYVEGMTFVCYSRVLATGGTDASLLFWDSTTQSLTPAGSLITDLPFGPGEIDGISSSNGYLLVYSALTVAWAPFDGTAFNFSIYVAGNYTGAGYQIPEDVQGNIKACVAVSGGFIMFTTKNAIAANYHSQNIATPWVFREISNGGGIESYEQATVEGSLGYTIAYTTTGLQKLSLNGAEEIHPDVSDFIADRYIERYNFGDHVLRQGATTLDFYTKITNVANRYLVISYGTFPNIFSFALVYDMSLKRWGKLRMVHKDCFYYNYGPETATLTYAMVGDVSYADTLPLTYEGMSVVSNGITAAQHGLAFLHRDGSVELATWSNNVRDTQDDAVVVIGRVQLTRSSNVQFNRIELEGLNTGNILLVPSRNGKDLDAPEALVTIEQSANFKVAGGMIDCKNFNLIVEGTFDLSTSIIEATTTGKI